jgi:hypothetical protein
MSAARSILFLLIAAVLGACASEHDLQTPAPSQAERHPLGCEVRLAAKGMVRQGELIGLYEGSYVLLKGNELMAVDTGLSFTRVIVVMGRTTERPNSYGWSALLPLVSISHGAVGIFTLPLNIIAAVSVNQGAAKSRYVVYLLPARSAELCKFARFPQGIPPSFLAYRQWSP